eukprot:CAMPEP_0181323398 /NCGR_PEP_ID=MMETSP1101-20121128/19765_1 /TAXON_ID=46948 /ORGANISM="Rhodomonas abbreviata, Strain Caron Lab Isolate" /LENGTH=92 /DNA_ID=CAMNT_0023431425 /DNA_START=26 /DNA_END=304 /DNA_ORIENTATION=+
MADQEYLYKPGHSSGQEAWKDKPGANYNCMVGAGGCKRLLEFAGPAFGDWSAKGGMEYGDWHHVTPAFPHHRMPRLPTAHPMDNAFKKAEFH